jgi:hypothetical protein
VQNTDLPLAERIVATIGETCAVFRASPAWVQVEVKIAEDRAEAETRGQTPDESRGKGLKSTKVGNKRLIFVDSICERLGISRDDLPKLISAPAPKQAPRGASTPSATAASQQPQPSPQSEPLLPPQPAVLPLRSCSNGLPVDVFAISRAVGSTASKNLRSSPSRAPYPIPDLPVVR